MKKIVLAVLFFLLVSNFLCAELARVTAKSGLYMRDQPSKAGEKKTKIKNGDSVEIVEKSSKRETIEEIDSVWYKIKFKGETGWVFGGYLDFSNTPPKPSVAVQPHFEAEEYIEREIAKAGWFSDKVVIKFPKKQCDFEDLRKRGWNEYDSAKNEIKQSAIWNSINSSTAAMMKSYNYRANRWKGKIYSLKTNKGGGRVDLELVSEQSGSKVYYMTPVYEIFSNDGIYAGSQAYNELSNLAEGDWVYFSCEFFKKGEGEVTPVALTERGSLDAPEFQVKFLEIEEISSIEK